MNRYAWYALGLATIVVSAWVFSEITDHVLEAEDLTELDGHLATWIAGHRIDWLTRTMYAVTVLGSGWITIPLVLAAALRLPVPGHRLATAVTAVAATAGVALIVNVIKLITTRPRPGVGEIVATAGGYSFPSGHSAQAIAAYGIVAWLIAIRQTYLLRQIIVICAAAIAALAIGVSRLYLGVHWLSDVLAGFSLATCWLALLLCGRAIYAELATGLRQ